MYLNLGCGSKVLEGFLNVDISAGPGVDLSIDLDDLKNHPLPIMDNQVKFTYISHTLEHLKNSLEFFGEIYRVMCDGGICAVRVPHFSNDGAWIDPTHIRPWHWRSFTYFSQPKYHSFDYGYSADFQPKEIFFSCSRGVVDKYGKKLLNIDFLHSERNLVEEMIVILECIKPARARNKDLMTMPKLGIQIHPYKIKLPGTNRFID